MKRLLILLFMLFFVSCAGRQTPIPEMGAPDAGVFLDRCGACHSVPHPKRHTLEQWGHIIITMDKETMHKGMSPLTGDERKSVLNYLKKHHR